MPRKILNLQISTKRLYNNCITLLYRNFIKPTMGDSLFAKSLQIFGAVSAYWLLQLLT